MLAPAAAAIGDKIRVLLGGFVSYAFRGRNKIEYEFVVECYIHGLMDGEIMADKESKNTTLIDFVLTGSMLKIGGS